MKRRGYRSILRERYRHLAFSLIFLRPLEEPWRGCEPGAERLRPPWHRPPFLVMPALNVTISLLAGKRGRKISPCFLSSGAITSAPKPIEPGRLRAEIARALPP